MHKPDPLRWQDLAPGDSIIERGDRASVNRLVASMARKGLVFHVEPQPVERPLLVTLIALTSPSLARTKDDAPEA
jgi:hypothetical protein